MLNNSAAIFLKLMNIKKILKKSIAVLILLLIWQAAAMLIDQTVLLASPWEVVLRLFTLIGEDSFRSVVGFSFARISLGFAAGLAAGCLLALLSSGHSWLETLLSPLMVTIKTVPVASFIIIALIWISSSGLSLFISFLMVLPVIYNNVLSGIRSIDPKMLQMSHIYRLSGSVKLKYITIPSVYPYFISACKISLGLAWKAGVAAEVIGIPTGSIGEKMYMSKIYLDSAGLLAWTVVIVIISVLFEKIVLWLLKRGYALLCSCTEPRQDPDHC